MPTIVFRQPDGTERTVHAVDGASVMEAALMEDVDGILGECGGHTMCGTCHVYVHDAFLDRLAPVTSDEDEMLDATAAPRRHNSRLSCRLQVGAVPCHLVVDVPERQV
ncbi:2Fe-2S iron-sulfur cluster-binding protein [Streptomyces sp. NPDC048297]|uniref:2Fe-2S iron-sulfur cluster-binding protein n=1 Tax=Streptomyces sp. NPDC048297 TaxID=3365531 RepID=UPI00372415D6